VLYVSHRPDQAPLMLCIRDLAATRTRYGYFRIYILPRSEEMVREPQGRLRALPEDVRKARNKEVAVRLGGSATTVTKWRRRFVAERLDGLRDEPRSGAPRTTEDAQIEAVIVRTLERPYRPQFPVKAAWRFSLKEVVPSLTSWVWIISGWILASKSSAWS
jgi:transposase-like protein